MNLSRVRAVLLSSALLFPSLSQATETLDEVRYKIKASDGNLWWSAYRGGRLIRGGCSHRCIAFTFDDGPSWETTPTLLTELERRRIPATFFVTGHRMDGDGEVARRNRAVMLSTWNRGHLIGNHTYHHDLLDVMSDDTLRFEIDRTAALIERALGLRSFLFRAPYGALHHPRAVRAVFSRGYTPVFWAMDSNDWRVTSAEAVLTNVRAELDRSTHGGVLLMHDTLPWSVAAFPLIVDEIEARNVRLIAQGQEPYRFVGLEDFYEPLVNPREHPLRPAPASPSRSPSLWEPPPEEPPEEPLSPPPKSP